MINVTTRRRLGVIATIIGGFYLVFAIATAFLRPDEEMWLWSSVLGVTGVSVLIAAALSKQIAEHNATAFAGLLGLIVGATLVFRDVLGAVEFRGYDYLLLMIASAALVLSRPWLSAIVTLSAAGWLFTSIEIGQTGWLLAIGYLAIVSSLCAAIHLLRHQTLVSLEERRLSAEYSGDSRTAFLANMSHEIRTPMSGVMGLSSLLLDTDLSPEQRKMARAIHGSTDALLLIVDEILDFSKLEKRQIQLERVRVRSHRVVRGDRRADGASRRRKGAAPQYVTGRLQEHARGR